jgi:CheY-like chemotaxis protein
MNTTSMVLIIDDREDQRNLFQAIVRRLGLGAHVVSSWEEAEASLETVCFDAVLMDVQMPDIDGIEATRRLRELDKISGRHTPIIAVTAKAMAGDREECLLAGMDDYLAKPFSIEQLKSVIERWAEKPLF